MENVNDSNKFYLNEGETKETINFRAEKSTAYSENSDNSNINKEENKNKKIDFYQKISQTMNEQLNIYDDIVDEIKKIYYGCNKIDKSGLNQLNLKNIARGLHVNINRTLSKKLRILIIGNSSAGKSTFINWYIQENIQKTGYEYETNHFTLITSGNYFCEFNGEVTIKTYDFLKNISNRNRNFKNNLCTKMYVNKNNETKNIVFIDTPGLKDNMDNLDYDINSIIYDLSDYVDIILIFFNSCDKSLSNRLILIIKEIYEKHMQKIFFIFSKIDEIRHEEDRIKLLCQTTQFLTNRINIRNNIDLIPIYIYGAKNGKYLFENVKQNDLCIVNRINDIIKEIKKQFFKKLQKDLYSLNNDCDSIVDRILEILKRDNEKRIHKTTLRRERMKYTLIQMFVLILLIFFLFIYILFNKYNYISRHLHINHYIYYINYIINTAKVFNDYEHSYLIVNVILLFSFMLCGIMKRKFTKDINILQFSGKEILRDQLSFVKFAKERGLILTKAFYELKQIH